MMGKALAHRPRRRRRQNRRLRPVQAISPPGAEARRGRRRLAQGGRGAGPQAVQVERARGALACRAEGRARRFRSLGRVSGDARDESLRACRSGGWPAVPGRVPGRREGVILRGVDAAALGLREPRLLRRPSSNLARCQTMA